MANKKNEPFVTLTQALANIKKKWPETPVFALRAAVAEGKVPSRRSSDRKKARYYVQQAALETWYLSNNKMPA